MAVIVALLVATAASAADQRSPWCMAWFDDPFDAQQAAQRYALANGAHSVMTFSCAAREYPHVVLHRTGSTCVTVPEAPYGWTAFAKIADAAVEYNAHPGAEARGVVTTYDGLFIVYWTKPAPYVTR